MQCTVQYLLLICPRLKLVFFFSTRPQNNFTFCKLEAWECFFLFLYTVSVCVCMCVMCVCVRVLFSSSFFSVMYFYVRKEICLAFVWEISSSMYPTIYLQNWVWVVCMCAFMHIYCCHCGGCCWYYYYYYLLLVLLLVLVFFWFVYVYGPGIRKPRLLQWMFLCSVIIKYYRFCSGRLFCD